jgi:hypothetical protein
MLDVTAILAPLHREYSTLASLLCHLSAIEYGRLLTTESVLSMQNAFEGELDVLVAGSGIVLVTHIRPEP